MSNHAPRRVSDFTNQVLVLGETLAEVRRLLEVHAASSDPAILPTAIRATLDRHDAAMAEVVRSPAGGPPPGPL